MIQKHVLQTHVTVLKFVEPNYILEGCGGLLTLYDLSSHEKLNSVNLFRGSRIYGIVPSNYEKDVNQKPILVHGGKLLSIVRVNDQRILVEKKPFAVFDWIQDTVFLDERSETIAILTSHNKFAILNWKTEIVLQEFQCSEQSILYCGKILQDKSGNVFILSGTVFQEILIWKPEEDENELCPVLHRLKGHNGVLFSLCFDFNIGKILSTSDDRSVRLWSRSSKPCKDLSTFFSHDAKFSQELELYGHEARVWRTALIDENHLCSFGEDSKVCVWNYKTGKLVYQWEAHQGGSIWGAEWIESLQLLVTGGADGSVYLWQVKQFLKNLAQKVPLELVEKNDYPRIVLLVGQTLLCLTNKGSLYSYVNQWDLRYQDAILSKCSCVQISPDALRMAVGTLDGDLLVFSIGSDLNSGTIFDLETKHRVYDGKIFAINFISQDCLAVCASEGRIKVFNLHDRGHVESAAEFILPPNRQRWITCIQKAVSFSESCSPKHMYLVGDREGSIYVYTAGQELPEETHQHIHGKHGVTDLVRDPSSADLCYSSGKDGAVRLWQVSEHNPKLTLINEIKTGISWITRIVALSGDFFYLGFHGADFVLWSSTHQRSVMEVPCGGGHRSWDFSASADNFKFVFIKDKEIFTRTFLTGTALAATLRPGLHTKSICTGLLISAVGEGAIFISGSEDTTIRISLAQQDSLKTICTIRKHISSVRTLAVCPVSDSGTVRRYLLVSGGGRAQLNIFELQIRENNNVIYRELRTSFLRSYSSGCTNLKPWVNPRLVVDPETRYMSLDLVERGEDDWLICAASSDGVIRIFEFSLQDRSLAELCELRFHEHCVLKVKIKKTSDERLILFSTATDGRVALWNLNELKEEVVSPFAWHCLHQSGINCIDIRLLDNPRNEFLVTTGGDDNTINCLQIQVDANLTESRLIWNKKLSSAHAAQISGIQIIGDSTFLSVSLDQRLFVWDVRPELEQGIMWKEGFCCDVADIQGLILVPETNKNGGRMACVYGQGVQVFGMFPM